MRYLIEGRLIPERVNANLPAISLVVGILDVEEAVHIKLSIIQSKIFCYIINDVEIHYQQIRNLVFTAVGDIVNYIGYRSVQGHSYEVDSITDLKNQSTLVFGVEGFVFDTPSRHDGLIAFRPAHQGDEINLPVDIIINSTISRATFELRNSIRYPDFTALHCRLAIETIRNAFDADDEARGWRLMRERLRIRRETIESFKDASDAQRHGRNLPQSWQQRQNAMQIAWEIVYRYELSLENKTGSPVDLPDF